MEQMNTTFQIDLLPIEGKQQYKQILYVFDTTYTSVVDKEIVDRMVYEGVVKQVKGKRHDENYNLIEFDYPNLVDSAGVQYTSCVFVLTEKK